MREFGDLSRGGWPRRGAWSRFRVPVACEVERLERREMLSGVQATYTVTQDWGSGFQAEIALRNVGDEPVTSWTLEFDYPARITSLWDGRMVSQSGTRYTVSHAGWNATLGVGQTVRIGFVAVPGSTPGEPTNYALNGMPLGEGGPPSPTAPPSISVDDVRLVEGNQGTNLAMFTVSLSKPAESLVAVDYATVAGTAAEGSDYLPVMGRLTFAVGESRKTVAVSVVGDAEVETDETFRLTLANPDGATLTKTSGVGTIVNDDTFPQPGAGIEFRVTSDWGSGFTGEITIRNQGNSSLTGWALEFDFGGQIASIWNSELVSQTGDRYVVKHATWNREISPGASATIGFTASPGGGSVSPAGFVLKTGQGSGTSNRTPSARSDSAYTREGQAARIMVLANDSDPDGDAISVSNVGAPSHGTAVRNDDGLITYTPASGFAGQDTFTYVITDARGATATAQVAVTVASATAAQWPERVYVPYVDMGLYPTYSLIEAAQSQGLRYFTLAFVQADPSGVPAWGGYAEYAVNGSAFDQAMRQQIQGVRALGGDVMVSFGGASGHELAERITDVKALKNAYRSVVDAYEITHVDFDIEGQAQADPVSVERRSEAIAMLQRELAAEGRSLNVWLTLPVLPTGLTHHGLNVVASAVQAGVELAGVNIMTMDYGDGAAPNPQGRMGDYAIQAGESLFGQLRGVYGSGLTDEQLYQMIGLTPMIGLNDVTTEIFDQQEAREVVAWAKSKNVGRISMWSLNRDFQHPNGVLGYVDLKSSSILQQPYEFSTIFSTYMD